MANYRVHEFVEIFVMGECFPKIHDVLDLPSFFDLPKFLHRIDLAMLIGYYFYGEQGIYAAILHINLDETLNGELVDIYRKVGRKSTTYVLEI